MVDGKKCNLFHTMIKENDRYITCKVAKEAKNAGRLWELDMLSASKSKDTRDYVLSKVEAHRVATA